MTHDTPRSVLLRPGNARISTYCGAKSAWPAIVDEQVWRNAVAILNNPARRTSERRAIRWLGTYIFTCSRCGGSARRAPQALVTQQTKRRQNVCLSIAS
jgi:site-specific DNA recombinase